MISRTQPYLIQVNQVRNIKLSIVIPTYNEKDNLPQFLDELKSTLRNTINYEIIIVDDNSPDGTGELADNLSRTNNDITVIHRPEKMGLASALLDGFKVIKGEFVLVSDADLQHSPAIIKMFLEEINQGADLVIASRYMSGGTINSWNPWRKLVSKGATLLAHLFFPKTRRVKDPLSGYFMVRKSGIVTIQLTGLSWKVLLEILVNGRFRKVTEVPYTFNLRTNGKSKLKPRNYLEYMLLIFLLRQ